MPKEPENEAFIVGWKAMAKVVGKSVSTIKRWRKKYPDFPIYQELKKPKRRVCQGCKAYKPVVEPHEDGPNVCAFDAADKCYWIAGNSIGTTDRLGFEREDGVPIVAVFLKAPQGKDDLLCFGINDGEDAVAISINAAYKRIFKEG